MDEVGLGKHLQAARTAAGLTQQQLCQQAGISYSTLAKIERGAIKAPSVFTIKRLAEVLGTSLDDLLGGIQPLVPQKQKHRSKSGVTFVYFDINGCLVRFFHQAFSKLAEDSDVSADLIETTFWHYNDSVCRGEMPLDEFNRIMAETCHIMVDWKQYYMSAVAAIPEMHEVVRWASENYRIGLLSNIMPNHIADMIQNDLIPNVQYDVIIDSSQVGTIKPEPQIFQIAQERAGVDASEILFIDDSRPNVMAAGQLGWKVMWFDDYRPDESVARVRDALEIADDNPVREEPSASPTPSPSSFDGGYVPHEIAL